MTLWLDEEIKLILVLADKFGKPLFEMCPNIFPHGYITDVEKLLWMHYYEHKAKLTDKNNG